MSGPCAGLVVVDCSRSLSGALLTMLLADFGAEVTLVEPPGGHPLRREPGFLVWGRGKRSLVADPASSADRELLRALIASADVLVESGADGEPSLAELPARLIACSLPAVAALDEEPLAADAYVAARAGIMAGQPGFRPGPVFVLPPLASYGAALLALQGLAAALYVRERTGRGQRVSASLLSGALAVQAHLVIDVERDDTFVADRRAPLGDRPLYRLYQCQDGRWLHLGVLTPRFWPGVAIAAERPEWISDPRFATAPSLRQPQRQALTSLLAAELDRLPFAEWERRFEEQDVPCAPAQTVDEFLRDPQVAAAGMLAQVDDPRVGPMRQPGLAIEFEGAPGGIRGPAPLLDADGAAIRATPWPSAPPAAEQQFGADAPLAGVRILDLSSFIAGPYGPALLADLGADVIKVEAPEGDGLRTGKGFVTWNRGKRGLAVDLKTEDGRQILYRLAADADVVIENMRPGVAERLGIDDVSLRRINARLITCSVTAYGADGPYRRRPGFDPLMQARSGIERAQGGLQNPPSFLRVAATDNTCAMLNGAGIVLALYARERTGRGQRLQTSLLRAACLLQSDSFVEYAGRPPRPANDPGQYGPHALLRLYRCADGWIFLAARPQQQAALLALLQLPAVSGAALADALADRFGRMGAGVWAQRLQETGIAALAVAEDYYERFADDAELQATGLITEHEHPQFGRVRMPAVLVGLSLTPGRAPAPAPLLGQHTCEILAAAGYEEAEIAGLLARGVVIAPSLSGSGAS